MRDAVNLKGLLFKGEVIMMEVIYMNLENTIKNLELRGYTVKHFATGAEAAALLQNALALPLSLEAVETSASLVEDAPVWAAEALTALQSHGICLSAQEQLTRADAAKALYQTSQLAVTAPGMAVFHMD